MMRLKCSNCGKPLSTEVPNHTVLRGTCTCPECENGWISVKDQMPGKEKFIMACNIRRIPDTLRIINPIFLTSAYTHWMPIPQILYAEEE